MRALALSIGLLALALPAAALAQAQGCTASSAANCDATKRESLADKFAPKSDSMDSFTRKGRDRDKNERQAVEQQINEAIMAGRCEDARKIAVDNGYHAAAAQIRRTCKS